MLVSELCIFAQLLWRGLLKYFTGKVNTESESNLSTFCCFLMNNLVPGTTIFTIGKLKTAHSTWLDYCVFNLAAFKTNTLIVNIPILLVDHFPCLALTLPWTFFFNSKGCPNIDVLDDCPDYSFATKCPFCKRSLHNWWRNYIIVCCRGQSHNELMKGVINWVK